MTQDTFHFGQNECWCYVGDEARFRTVLKNLPDELSVEENGHIRVHELYTGEL